MGTVVCVELLAFGFDTEGSLSPAVAEHLDRLHGRGIIRILDVLAVSKDEQGIFRINQHGNNLGTRPASVASALWQLLGGHGPPFLPSASLELQSSGEVGLDLAAVENLAQLIPPGTSALLILVEPTWVTDLLDAVVTAGGFPIVYGCLEPETMLVTGGSLAAAAGDASARERTAARRGAAMLDALASAQPTPAVVATDVIPALVDARLLDDCDVEDAIGALAAAGLVPVSSLARAREHADAMDAETERTGIRRDDP
jgi:uncharacterized membrane protein